MLGTQQTILMVIQASITTATEKRSVRFNTRSFDKLSTQDQLLLLRLFTLPHR